MRRTGYKTRCRYPESLPKEIFPGRAGLFSVLLERYESRMPIETLIKFNDRLRAASEELTADYYEGVLRRNARRGIPMQDTIQAIGRLAAALKSTVSVPFSDAVSPFVDIRTGELTELGKTVAMTESTARRINSPDGRMVKAMQSAPWVSFEDISTATYTAFGYARSGITSGGKPLLWMPGGNSLAVGAILEHLTDHQIESVTVINLGSGPGTLENMLLGLKGVNGKTASRLEVVSVDNDPSSLQSLRRIVGGADRYVIIEGDFTKLEIQERIRSMIIGTPFIVAGYSLHHVSPTSMRQVLEWFEDILRDCRQGYVHIHDVNGGVEGGGRSPVNRVFFNLMSFYHLLAIYPNSIFAKEGYDRVSPRAAADSVRTHPDIFVEGTTPETMETMVKNGSVRAFVKKNLG